MAQGTTPITFIGNLTDDPELRYTPSGTAVANIRIASTPRQYNSQTNQWEDGDATFLNATVWRDAAENVAQSISKGQRVIVSGVLAQRTFETKNGDMRSVIEIQDAEVGPSLKFATATVQRPQGGQGKSGTSPQGGFGGSRDAAPQVSDDPWGVAGQEPPF